MCCCCYCYNLFYIYITGWDITYMEVWRGYLITFGWAFGLLALTAIILRIRHFWYRQQKLTYSWMIAHLCNGDLYSHYSKQFKIKSEYDWLKNIWLGQQTRCKQLLFCSHVSFVIILRPSPPLTSSHPLAFHVSIILSQTNMKCQGLSLNILYLFRFNRKFERATSPCMLYDCLKLKNLLRNPMSSLCFYVVQPMRTWL